MERHRFLALLLRATPASADLPLLDVAPHRQIRRVLVDLVGDRYVGIDRFEDRSVDVWGDLTRLPFPGGAFGMIVCYHVLEHVPDDAGAVAELSRVLTPGGVALVQVPWRQGRPTDEDPAADPVERVRRFGQADHVRWYGDDFEDRLRAGGLDPARVRPRDLLTPEQLAAFALMPDEVVWLCGHDGEANSVTDVEDRVRALAREAERRARRAALVPPPIRRTLAVGGSTVRRARRRLLRLLRR